MILLKRFMYSKVAHTVMYLVSHRDDAIIFPIISVKTDHQNGCSSESTSANQSASPWVGSPAAEFRRKNMPLVKFRR